MREQFIRLSNSKSERQINSLQKKVGTTVIILYIINKKEKIKQKDLYMREQ